jgi:hypothetical protein
MLRIDFQVRIGGDIAIVSWHCNASLSSGERLSSTFKQFQIVLQ